MSDNITKYTCDICNYETDVRQYFYKHKKSKKHILKSNESAKVNLLVIQSNPKVIQSNPQKLTTKDNDSAKINKCILCSKVYAYKQGLTKHKKTCNKANIIEQYETKIKLIEKECELKLKDQEG